MISLSQYIKKFLYILLVLILVLQIITTLINFYVIKKTFEDSLISISSLLTNISKGFDAEVSNRIKLAKILFKNIEKEILKNKNIPLTKIQKKIEKKYKGLFEIAFVNKHGFIIESTVKKEIGLNLMAFSDLKKILLNAKKNPNRLVINYPIFDPGDKIFKIFLIKYILKKKYYFLIGYKFNLLNIIATQTKQLSKIKNFKYHFHSVYIYEKNKKIKIVNSQRTKKEKHEEFIKLIKENRKELIKKTLFGIELFKIITITPLYCFAFHIKLTSVRFKKEVIIFLVANLSILIIYIGFLLYLYKKINFELISPLKKLRKVIDNSEILPKGYLNTKILEIKNLKDSYFQFIENIKLRKFIKKILEINEKEKENIGIEIHDSIIQDLNYILLRLEDDELKNILKEKIKHLKKIVVDNDLTLLKVAGFNVYIDFLIKSYKKRYPDIEFEKNIEEIKISSEKAINIIRIIQEIINNSLKHSNCSKIIIDIYKDIDQIKIFIADNGKGFNVEETEFKTDHFGLIHIKERVFILNGKIKIISNSNGTQYIIIIPDKKLN